MKQEKDRAWENYVALKEGGERGRLLVEHGLGKKRGWVIVKLFLKARNASKEGEGKGQNTGGRCRTTDAEGRKGGGGGRSRLAGRLGPTCGRVLEGGKEKSR